VYSRTRVLTHSPDSPTFAKLADIRQPVLLGLAKLAEIRELFCSDSPKFTKGYFS
jgi:hypothetical protein